MELEPDDTWSFKKGRGDVLLIGCGALAREIVDLVERNRWQGFDVQCLPAIWHNRPERIADGVREKIKAAQGRYRKIFVLYGDCGTGGALDKVLSEEGVERIEGPHCYSFFSGNEAFGEISEGEFDAFYLTDYLARHFDKLVWQGLGLDRHPELLEMYFGNYSKIVYLAQTQDATLQQMAEAAAAKLSLAYEFRFTGYGDLETALAAAAKGSSPVDLK